MSENGLKLLKFQQIKGASVETRSVQIRRFVAINSAMDLLRPEVKMSLINGLKEPLSKSRNHPLAASSPRPSDNMLKLSERIRLGISEMFLK